MMNQCDGCLAGVETYSRDGITWHVMGSEQWVGGRIGFKHRDLMICEAGKYEHICDDTLANVIREVGP